jgi:hypothetical protein
MGGFKPAIKIAEKAGIVKKVEQPKVPAQMDNSNVKSDLVNADKTAPTSIEMNQDEDILKRKKRGRRSTVLSSITGDTSKPELSSKTLLG